MLEDRDPRGVLGAGLELVVFRQGLAFVASIYHFEKRTYPAMASSQKPPKNDLRGGASWNCIYTGIGRILAIEKRGEYVSV